MTRILQKTETEIKESSSIVEFMTEGGGHWPVWDRFLTIEGKKAYHIGNVCGTCSFFFERMEGANKKISPRELSERLEKGIRHLDAEVVDAISTLMPIGKYRAYLLEVMPKLVLPGSENDYFSHEQVDLCGMDQFWGFPHFPKTDYYRLSTQTIKDKGSIFEFLIPLFPKNWLKQETLEKYQNTINTPTAISLSVLDVKWADTKAHYCLAHYLLDGHHKTYSASQSNKKMNVISFLSIDKGISSMDDIEFVFNSLSKAEDH